MKALRLCNHNLKISVDFGEMMCVIFLSKFRNIKLSKYIIH